MGIIAGGGFPDDDGGRGSRVRAMLRSVFFPARTSAGTPHNRPAQVIAWAVVIVAAVVLVAARLL